jgi:diacylglycerol kinase (ATP)
MEAATGLAEAGSAAPIGILPGGTGNQLARALQIPLRPSRAVSALLAGERRHIDLADLDGQRRVGIGAGVGLDAAMIAGARGRLKRWLGVGAYVVSATRASLKPRRFPVRVEVDGRVIEREAVLAMALNLGHAFNGVIELAPGSSLTDGLLDLVLVDARHGWDAVMFAVTELLLHRRRPHPRWEFARGREIRIEPLVLGIPCQADGDLLSARSFTLRVAPGAGQVLIPKGSAII